MLKDYPDVLTVKDLAEILRVGIDAAYKILNTNIICSRRIGKRFLIPKKCVIDYLESIRYNNSV
jgi:excisionase family DNA binding protein